MPTGLLLLLTALVLAGCGFPNLHTGDEGAIGATIEGRTVGELTPVVYTGSTSNDPVLMERERQRTGLVPGTKFAVGQVYVPDGVHELRITSRTGKMLSTRLTMQGENYIGVSFADMEIRRCSVTALSAVRRHAAPR